MTMEWEPLFRQLLDADSRRSAFAKILGRLGYGQSPYMVIEALEDPELRMRVREVFGGVLFDVKLRRDFQVLASEGYDLEAGSFLIARPYIDPSESLTSMVAMLDGVTSGLAEKLTGLPPSEHRLILDIFLEHIFKENQFKGNDGDYYNPENCLLPSVLKRRTGIPVTLCVVALLVARRVELPLHGLNIPGHFMMEYRTPEVQYFVDPFGTGVYSLEEFRVIASRLGAQEVRPADERSILLRMMRTLAGTYQVMGDEERERTVRNHMILLEASGENNPVT